MQLHEHMLEMYFIKVKTFFISPPWMFRHFQDWFSRYCPQK